MVCPLNRFGVSVFVLISTDDKTQVLVSEAQANIMLSTVSTAIANTRW